MSSCALGWLGIFVDCVYFCECMHLPTMRTMLCPVFRESDTNGTSGKVQISVTHPQMLPFLCSVAAFSIYIQVTDSLHVAPNKFDFGTTPDKEIPIERNRNRRDTDLLSRRHQMSQIDLISILGFMQFPRRHPHKM